MKSEDFVGGGVCAGVGDVQQLVQNCGGAVGKLGHLGAGVTYEIFIKSS